MMPVQERTPAAVGSGHRLELLIVCALLFAAGAVVLTWYPVNHDSAWMLHVARRWLEGARLYVDVVEVNPPLIIMLLTPAAAISRLLGVWDISVFYFGVLALAGISLWLVARTLSFSTLRLEAPILIVALAAIYVFLPHAEIGQREHLMLLLASPYLFAVALRSTGEEIPAGHAVVIGVLAGIGFALKPHFLIAFVGSEMYLGYARRTWIARRPELVAIVAVGLLYALVLLLVARPYLGLASWASRVYGDFYPSSAREIAGSAGTWLAALTMPAAFLARHRPGAAVRHVFALAAAGFTLMVFVQNKNWDYHWLPVYASCGIVWTSLAIEAARIVSGRVRLPVHGGPRALRRIALWTFGILLTWAGVSSARAAADEAWVRLNRIYQFSSIATIIEQLEGPQSWFALSASMQTSLPLVTYMDLEWSARFNCLWPLSGLYEATPPNTDRFPYRTPDEMGETERYVFDATLEDLFRARPTLILVDRYPPGGRLHGFDYFAYFSADPRFVEFMKDYALLADLGAYRIYQRT